MNPQLPLFISLSLAASGCLVSISACSSVCPAGTFSQNGRCVTLGTIDAGPEPDGGPGNDTGSSFDGGELDAAVSDASLDGSSDGGACGACPTETPVCDTSRDPALCVACTAADLGSCDPGTLCDLRDGSCTDRVAGVRTLCGECVRSAECEAGFSCVEVAADGPRCLWNEAAAAPGPAMSCASNGGAFARRVVTEDLDGAEATVCALAEATGATCAAWLQYREQTCESDDDCGVAEVEDGVCIDMDPGEGETLRCTLPCVSDRDCPGDCDRIRGHCEL